MTIEADNTLGTALALEGVYAGYSKDLDILQDISLGLSPGALQGLIGLNGAGKSTLLMAAMGFVRPRRGRVYLHGEDISGIPPHNCIGRGLYMLPQQSSLFPYLSVRQNLDFVAKARGSDIAMALEQFPDLKAYLRVQAGDLSGGWQKMLEFAKALLARPQVLLVDEPSVGLSPAFAREVYEWLRVIREHQDIAVLLVDHNIEQAVTLTDYMYVLSLGRIVAQGPTQEFSGDLRAQVQRWLGLERAPQGAQKDTTQ